SKPLLFPSVSVRPIIIWRIRRAVTGSLPAPPNSAARLNPNENDGDGANPTRIAVNHGRRTSPLRSMRASSSAGCAGPSTRKGPGSRTPSPPGATAPPSNATASDNTAPPPSPGPSANARRPNHASAPPALNATYASPAVTPASVQRGNADADSQSATLTSSRPSSTADPAADCARGPG